MPARRGSRTPQHRPHDVVVIGGGVSGLTAAVDLASRGFSVLLVEQKGYCGGRTHSFVDKKTGDEVDNGQHLMMGCYHSALRFLSTIGSKSAVAVQENLSVTFAHPRRGRFRLQAVHLPPPLHVLAALMRLRSLTLPQRFALMRVGKALLSARPERDPMLQSITVSEWLERLRQPADNKKYLWDIIAIGTLNDSPDLVSAALFVKVLQSAFLGSRLDSSMVIPRKGLSRVFVDPAIEFLIRNNGAVRLNTSVVQLVVRDGAVAGVTLNTRETVPARSVVSAVPYYDAEKFLGDGGERNQPWSEIFTASAIITIHIWFDRNFVDEEFVALLDSPIHWVFNKTKICGQEEGELSYLSLVVSGAAAMAERKKEDLVALALSELRRFYPPSGDARLVHSVVIKERRATFSPRVGTEHFRPSHTTALRNLFLAGDWTDTKLPATIEGAVQSGYACSELVRRVLKEQVDARSVNRDF